VELAAANQWPYGRDPNVIRDGPRRKLFDPDAKPLTAGEAMDIDKKLDKAGEDMRSINKFEDDQEKFNDKLEATIMGMKGEFDKATDEAHEASASLEVGLRKMNDKAMKTAFDRVNKAIQSHYRATSDRISKNHADARKRIGGMMKTYHNSYNQLQNRVEENRADQMDLRDKLDGRKDSLSKALSEFEKVTDKKLAALATRIKQLRSQLRLAAKGARADMDDADSEISMQLEKGLKEERASALSDAEKQREETQGDFSAGMKQLGKSIDGLEERSKRDITRVKKDLAKAKEMHAKESKKLSERAQKVTSEASKASGKVYKMAGDLDRQVKKLRGDMRKARAALKREHAGAVAKIKRKVSSAVSAMRKAIAKKSGEFGTMRKQVRGWLHRALALERKSRGWHHARQTKMVADLVRRYSDAQGQLAALERAVHKIDARQVARERAAARVEAKAAGKK